MAQSPLRGGRRRRPGRLGPGRVAAVVLVLALVALALVAWRASAASSAPPSFRVAAAARIIRAEFGAQLAPCFVSISRRETGGTFDPRAANWRDVHSDGSRGSFGLFQIGAVHRSAGESVRVFARRMFNPRANAAMAHRLYRGAGLQPWGGYC